jgi:DNA-binding response OmpR family regulator
MLLTAHDVTFDLAERRVERAGRPLDLTLKEQSLLLLFLRHPGEVLSRARIYEHVWDARYDGASNTLEVHIVEIRRKLEAHGPRLIHTLRGRGYLFGKPPGPQTPGGLRRGPCGQLSEVED